jgi:rhamnosyltransferase
MQTEVGENLPGFQNYTLMASSDILPYHFSRATRMKTEQEQVTVIIRSFNEGWALEGTLNALRRQDHRNWELIVIDSGSTDGSVDLIRSFGPSHFVQIAPSEYHPSRVMNHAMRLSTTEWNFFLNADATPLSETWLLPLLRELKNEKVAAVFGRQVPRPGCRAVYEYDYERCFGPNRESAAWTHFFSMVSSGVRRSVWAKRGFDERFRYSEDDEFARWCKREGHEVRYCPESVVMHSHNYNPGEAYRRSFGEGFALAGVWEGDPRIFSWPRSILGCMNDLRKDVSWSIQSGRIGELPHSARIRWKQRVGKLRGFKEGWQYYRREEIT